VLRRPTRARPTLLGAPPQPTTPVRWRVPLPDAARGAPPRLVALKRAPALGQAAPARLQMARRPLRWASQLGAPAQCLEHTRRTRNSAMVCCRALAPRPSQPAAARDSPMQFVHRCMLGRWRTRLGNLAQAAQAAPAPPPPPLLLLPRLKLPAPPPPPPQPPPPQPPPRPPTQPRAHRPSAPPTLAGRSARRRRRRRRRRA